MTESTKTRLSAFREELTYCVLFGVAIGIPCGIVLALIVNALA